MEVLARYCNLSYQREQLGRLTGMVPAGRNDAEKPRHAPGRARQLRPTEVEALVDAYRAGATVYELAEVFGISRQTVSGHLHRCGVQMRRQGLTVRQVDEAATLYGQGLSLARIGARFGVDAGTVRARLLEREVRMRDTHGRRR